MNQQQAIEADDLHKSFGRTHALNGLTLHVNQGEVHGFLGPNGAGKSATMRALLGQLRLDSGTARIFGHDCWSDGLAARRRIAYVPGDVSLWPGLSGGECITALSRLQGSSNKARRAELIERFQFDPSKRTRTYSKGNRQKVALVAALSADVDMLMLDEPTSGLDPLMEAVFQQCVAEAKAKGQTVLLSSHILSEVEALCDRVSIVRAGRIVNSGTLDDLRSQTRITITATLPGATVNPFEGVDGVVDQKADVVDGALEVELTSKREALPELLTILGQASPTAVTVRPPTLDELFLAEYSEDAR